MSAQRSLLLSTFSLLSVTSLLITGFLLVQRFVILPAPFVPTVAAAQMPTGSPTQISIPSQHIQLSLFPAIVVDNHWPTTTQGVSLEVNPSQDKNNSYIMYGHNWPSLLGNLHKVEVGDVLLLHYEEGQEKQFRIEKMLIIAPTQLEVLQEAKENTVLLYTCTGFLDRLRLVVVAKLIS